MRFRYVLLLFICFLPTAYTFAITSGEGDLVSSNDSTQLKVEFLNQLFDSSSGWMLENKELGNKIQSLVHFFDDENPELAVDWLEDYLQKDSVIFDRSYLYVEDSLSVPGYIPASEIAEQQRRLDRSVQESIIRDQIPVPEQLLMGMGRNVKTVSPEESDWLLEAGIVSLPDSLSHADLSDPSYDENKEKQKDSLRVAFVEEARLEYNQKLTTQYVDSITKAYRDEYVVLYSQKVQRELADSLMEKNRELLIAYNDSVIQSVNNSVQNILKQLAVQFHEEPAPVSVYNTDMKGTILPTNDAESVYTRLFIKNELNDSLNVKIENAGRNSIIVSIDDAAMISRFTQREAKETSLQTAELNNNIHQTKNRFTVVTPWKMGIDGNVGFTQTYLSNWKKGGKSSLSALFIFKGFANYSIDKLKWENSLEVRNGWINPADDKVQKNDDKFEVISRVGVSAFKEWYYSLELDFQTQLFHGYKYPDRDNLISNFLSPAKTLIKLGLDYKPNNDLSVFLSPLTAKNVFVKDSAHIDVTNFGIAEGDRSFWTLGLNAEVKYKKELIKDITYETKYKMFSNYKAPFSAVDVDWENNLTMQVNSFISLKLLLHLIYDDNVTFPTDKVDIEGNTIFKPKWQLKEFVTIGFSYKIDKQINRRKKLN